MMVAVAQLLAACAPPLPRDTAGPPPRGAEVDLSAVAIEDLMNVPIEASTKTPMRAAESPAIVTVVPGEEIRARGYTSLAGVLRTIPGFYDVYDGVSHNVGVRGISGGARASGNTIKLMIDGQPVDYRVTTGNFFGEELIPLSVVERIEIIRGPSSALYGANAFLGTINVVTRGGADLAGARVVGFGAAGRGGPGGGGGLAVGAKDGGVDVVAAAEYRRFDRSGLELPDSSPAHDELAGRGPTEGDVAQPGSLFARLSLDGVAGGRLSLLSSVQRLDARGELLDFGPLSHGTRIVRQNQNHRLAWELELSRQATLTASAHWFQGEPGDDERLDIGRDDFVLRRSSGARGGGFGLESQVAATPDLTFTQGADLVFEHHVLQTFDMELTEDVRAADGTVLRSRGTVIPGEAHGATRDLTNVGLFAQAVLAVGHGLQATAGARLDHHSLYGANLSARAAAVYSPEDGAFSLKLLYGSSFKAPSAEQLFTQPIKVLDIRGNPDLDSQTAHTIEAGVLARLPWLDAEVAGNVFALLIYDRVEYIQRAQYLTARNISNEAVAGAELEARLKLVPALRLRLSAGAARTFHREGGVDLPGVPEVDNPGFPALQVHVIADWLAWRRHDLTLSAEGSYVSARAASQSNSLLRGGAYDLPAYVSLCASASARWRLFGRDGNVALRVEDLLDRQWSEPGFGGIDLPTAGIAATLTLGQSL